MKTKKINKFIQRFNTKIIKGLEQYQVQNKQEEKVQVEYTSSTFRFQSPQYSTFKQAKLQNDIVQRLERHVKFLQRKMKEQEIQHQRIQNLIQILRQDNLSKQIQNRHLNRKLEEVIKENQKEKLNYQLLKSDYQKNRLLQSIKVVSKDLEEEKKKADQIQLKHNNYKRGIFSHVLKAHRSHQRLPIMSSPFIKEVEFQKQQKFGVPSQCFKNGSEREPTLKDIFLESNYREQIEQINSKLQKQFEHRLDAQTQQLNKRSQRLQQEIKSKNMIIIKKKAEVQEERNRNEYLRSENGNFINMLKIHKEKILQLTLRLKQREDTIELIERNRQNIHQIEHQFNPHTFIQKNYANLDLDSMNVLAMIFPIEKMREQKQTQTQHINNPQNEEGKTKLTLLMNERQILNTSIILLKKEIEEKEQLILEINQKCLEESKFYMIEIDKLKTNIRSLDKIIENYEEARGANINHQKIQTQITKAIIINQSVKSKQSQIDADVQFEFQFQYDQEKNQEILSKIKLLMEINAHQKIKIEDLQQEKQKLLEFLLQSQEIRTESSECAHQINEERDESLDPIDSFFENFNEYHKDLCQKCQKYQIFFKNVKKQLRERDNKLRIAMSQRSYFLNLYNQAIQMYKNYQIETNKELNRANLQLEQKQITVKQLKDQVDLGGQQIYRKDQQIEEYQHKKLLHDQQIERYQARLETMKEEIALLQQNGRFNAQFIPV